MSWKVLETVCSQYTLKSKYLIISVIFHLKSFVFLLFDQYGEEKIYEIKKKYMNFNLQPWVEIIHACTASIQK